MFYWSRVWNLLLYIYQNRTPEFISFFEMLDKNRSVVVDYELFHYQYEKPSQEIRRGIFIKELSACAIDYADTVVLKCPIALSFFNRQRQSVYRYQQNYIHGLHWNEGDYPYSFLTDFIASVKFRNSSGQR